MGNKTRKKYKKNKIIILTYPILSYTLGRRLGMAVACREELVGGAHPKKNKIAACGLLPGKVVLPRSNKPGSSFVID